MYFPFFFFAVILAISPFLQVARCQPEAEADVETICVFPKSSSKWWSPLNTTALQASVHLPYDHQLLVQNLTPQTFENSSVSPWVQATFPYMFDVNKYFQPGTFYLASTVVYHIDQTPYQNTFYNGTIEVVTVDDFVRDDSVFHATIGIAFLVLLGVWFQGQFQRITKDEANGEYHVDVDDEEDDDDDVEIVEDCLKGGHCTECNRINSQVFVCSETGSLVSFHKECMTWKLDSDVLGKFYCRCCSYKQEGARCKEPRTLSDEQIISTAHEFDNVGNLESIKDVEEDKIENSEGVILSSADEGIICVADGHDVGIDTKKPRRQNLCWAEADVIVLDDEDEIENGGGAISSAVDEGSICEGDLKSCSEIRLDKMRKKPSIRWTEAEVVLLESHLAETKISLDKVLGRGRSGFHPNRTEEGLAQKWKKIKKAKSGGIGHVTV